MQGRTHQSSCTFTFEEGVLRFNFTQDSTHPCRIACILEGGVLRFMVVGFGEACFSCRSARASPGVKGATATIGVTLDMSLCAL